MPDPQTGREANSDPANSAAQRVDDTSAGTHESESDTVSHWLRGIRAGESIAAQKLWSRYFEKLIPIARRRMEQLNRERSEEDIALSAIKSVMVGLQEDRFPDLRDRDSLWRLLITITARKAISEQRRQLAGTRDRNREVNMEDVAGYVGSEPTHEFAVVLTDELEHLVQAFDDDDLRKIVELKLAGWTNAEIAEKLDCTTRTITRKIARIRLEWCDSANVDVEEFE